MMPAETKIRENEDAIVCSNGILDSDVMKLSVENTQENISNGCNIENSLAKMDIMPNFESSDNRRSTCDYDPSLINQENKNLALVEYIDLKNSVNNCSACPDSFLCLKNSENFLDENLDYKSEQHKKYYRIKLLDLEKYSLNQLQLLVEDLSNAVERVSSELVQLLLENDALQQESDARNVAIEQLLKMTVKITESESKPIQMSVVLPSEECDDI